MKSRVLLTGPGLSSKSTFDFEPASFENDTDYIPDALNSEVLDRIAQGEFDAVVCEADGLEALDLVNKVRGRNDRVPIVLVSERPDSEFKSQAITSGASSVIAGNLQTALVSETIALVMKMKIASRDLAVLGETNEKLRRELQSAVLKSRAISRYANSPHRQWRRRGLLPLLVENDPAEAFALVKAFEKAEVFAPLPIMRSPQEALSYLQGTPPYENRNLHPLPNSILIDLSPPDAGAELARWIRLQSSLQGIPIIVLSASGKPEESRRLYGNHANSFLFKPGDFDNLVSLVQAIDLYWTGTIIGRPS